MKKILILLIAVLSLSAFGQTDGKIKESGVTVFNVTVADTVIKDGTVNFDIYVTDFAKYSKVQPELRRVSGTYTKAKVYTYTSIDYSTWLLKDSVLIGSTDSIAKGAVSAIDTTYAQYIRYTVAPYDSTQSIIPFRYRVLIDK